MKEDFYIGWSDKTPKSSLKAARRFFICSLIILLTVAVVFVINQVGYINSKFEFGTLTEVEGQLINEPAWGVKTSIDGEAKTVLLVGFGKFGADETIESLIMENRLKSGDQVTLRGTLFYYRGKYGMELTESENSLISSSLAEPIHRVKNDLGEVTLEGEIVDSKCFFGVMNPATNAVHRSCAIRCISGGITPVFAMKDAQGFSDFYIIENITDARREELLSFVGLPIKVKGTASQIDDWKTINLQSQSLESVAQNELNSIASAITICY